MPRCVSSLLATCNCVCARVCVCLRVAGGGALHWEGHQDGPTGLHDTDSGGLVRPHKHIPGHDKG